MKKQKLSIFLIILILLSLFNPLGQAETKEAKAKKLSPALEMIKNDEGIFPASEFSKQEGYWETKIDISDEKAVWAALQAPIYVLKGKQKSQTLLLSEPNDKAEAVGEITNASQGLHILKTLKNGYSLVELRSSSFYGSKLKRWNELIKGYVKTANIIKITPNKNYGLVVDKLTQRLYIFKEGKLYDTLRVSTGLVNKKQPFNETRSGEFLLVSRVGGFWSDNMLCAMAIRFNFGDLMHEVPHIPKDGKKNYGAFEERLGKRASHGCIRVQRKATGLKTNMAWLWNTLANEKNVKLMIWEDGMGRQIPYPDDDRLIYIVEKNKTRWYHDRSHCVNIRKKDEPMKAIKYGDMENGDYGELKPCTFCVPPLRRKAIDEINAKQK